MLNDLLARRLNPNLWYLTVDRQLNSVIIKKGGEIRKIRYLFPLSSSTGELLYRSTKKDGENLLRQLKETHSDLDIIKYKDKIINQFK